MASAPCTDPGWTLAVKVQLASVIAQAVVLLVAIVSLVVTLLNVKKQLWLTTFNEFTKRYADAMHHMPFDARRPGPPKNLESVDEEYRKNVLAAMRRYFNLCSEELYLNSRKKIDRETWDIWLAGITDCAKEPYFGSAWEYLRAEYGGYPEFCQFLDSIVAKIPSKSNVDSDRS